MITGFLINALYVLFYNIISVLPDSGTGLPTGITDAITLMVSYLNTWSWLLPVWDAVVVIGIYITFEIVIMSVKIALWLIRTIRGSGS